MDTKATRVARATRERGIDRVLKLFAFLQENRGPIRLAELPDALNAPKSTIYDLVNILAESGLLEISEKDSLVYFGKLMHLYGMSYLRANDVIAKGRTMVDALARETGETSELCIRLRGKQVIIHACPGSHRVEALLFRAPRTTHSLGVPCSGVVQRSRFWL